MTRRIFFAFAVLLLAGAGIAQAQNFGPGGPVIRGGASRPMLDLRFAGNSQLGRVTFSRTSSRTCFSAARVRFTVGTDAPCFDHDPDTGESLGLSIEGQRTNYFLDSDSPATQTSGTLGTGAYTCWIEGSGSLATAENTGTATGEGTATEGSPNTFTVSGAGTFDWTITGDVTLAQCEDGPFPSSYMPATDSAATRTPDLATITDLGWFNETAGIFTVSYRTAGSNPGGSTNYVILTLEKTGPVRLIYRISNGANPQWTGSDDAASTTFALDLGTNVSGTDYVAGLKFSNSGAAGLLSDGTLQTDSDVALPTGIVRLRLGANSGGGQYMFGWIKQLSYYRYPTADAFLQVLISRATP